MNNVKKNNKGFSLVELIVVVLIMAIIAVSLAPQVMKWVDRSRQANDASNYEALVSAAQLSVIAAPAGTTTSGGTTTDNVIVITMKKAASGVGTSIAWETDKAGTTAQLDAFDAALDANLPDWQKIAITSTEDADKEYTIKITNTTVTKGNAPDEISAN